MQTISRSCCKEAKCKQLLAGEAGSRVLRVDRGTIISIVAVCCPPSWPTIRLNFFLQAQHKSEATLKQQAGAGMLKGALEEKGNSVKGIMFSIQYGAAAAKAKHTEAASTYPQCGSKQ
jgi:hypothetical protein